MVKYPNPLYKRHLQDRERLMLQKQKNILNVPFYQVYHFLC